MRLLAFNDSPVEIDLPSSPDDHKDLTSSPPGNTMSHMDMRAWYLLICVLVTPLAHSQTETFSFAVKGGVSLGSYEAGLNWVYLEEIKRRQHRLNTFTGASAGSINALMSAIRYCEEDTPPEVENNIFRRTWDIGMKELVGKDEDRVAPEYRDFIDEVERNISLDMKEIVGDDRGGLFNRAGLLNSLKNIYLKIQSGRFKEGCEVKVGVSVTKFVPDSYTINGINVKNQRYIIPFIVRVNNQKLIFSNSPDFNSNQLDQTKLNNIDHYIFLPQNKSGISVFDIFRAVIASSAFPIAFPPVHLNYCIAGRQIDSNAKVDCPKGYISRKDLFIDGGSLDNAPIGSARRLSQFFSCSKDQSKDCLIEADKAFNLVYINPGRIRERQKTKPSPDSSQNQDNVIVGMIDYIALGGHIMEYGMSAELYRSLSAQANDGQVNLLSSSRFYPLVGDYIEHFGAFFDGAYRRFDYYTGIYDGVINVASSLCRQKPADESCIATESRKILASLKLNNKTDSTAYLMFVLLASKEFYTRKDNPAWQWLFEEYSRFTLNVEETRHEDSVRGKVVDIFHALDVRDCITQACNHLVEAPSFKGFLTALTNTGRYDPNTRNMVKSPKNWNHTILDGLLKRAIAVEEMKLKQLNEKVSTADINSSNKKALTQERNTQQVLVSSLEIVSLYGQSFFKRNSHGYWPASTLQEDCLSSSWSWLCLIPDEFGIHSDNVGGYFSYRIQFPGIFREQSFDIGIDPLHFALNTDDYASLETLYRFENSNVFLTSIGIGLKFYQTLGEKDRFIDNRYFGLVGKIGLFSDKLKLTAAYRIFDQDFNDIVNGDLSELHSGEVNFRQRVELTIGISDLRGISNILF
jgi:predicted acylesterase/phospholipase RssA